MSIEELEAESGRIYEIIADIEAGEPPSLDDVQWMIQRIAELEEVLNQLLESARYMDVGDMSPVAFVLNGPIVDQNAVMRARAVLRGDAPKLPEEIESSVRQMLADPSIKRDVREFEKTMRPTAEDMSRRIGDAPKKGAGGPGAR